MFSKIKKAFVPVLAGLILFGCASSSEEEERLNAIAAQRAQTLSAGLPIEHGPLKIMQVKAKGTVIELMMIYNDSYKIPVQQLMERSVLSYCTDPEVKKNLEQGISYQVKIRNSRGQLLVEQRISADLCY